MELAVSKIKVRYSALKVGSEVELTDDSTDHECGKKGAIGVVVAKHVSVVPVKFFVRLKCGHGNCFCTVTRDQIKKASAVRGRN